MLVGGGGGVKFRGRGLSVTTNGQHRVQDQQHLEYLIIPRYDGYLAIEDVATVVQRINQLMPMDFLNLVNVIYHSQNIDAAAVDNLYVQSAFVNHSTRKALRDNLESLEFLLRNTPSDMEAYSGSLSIPGTTFDEQVPKAASVTAGPFKLGVVALAVYGFPTPAGLPAYQMVPGGAAAPSAPVALTPAMVPPQVSNQFKFFRLLSS